MSHIMHLIEFYSYALIFLWPITCSVVTVTGDVLFGDANLCCVEIVFFLKSFI